MQRTKLALNIIVAGLTLGVLGDALLRIGPWGINAFLWTALIGSAIALMVWHNGMSLNRRAAGMVLAAVVTAGGMAWREAEALKVLDLAALCVLFAMAASQAREARWLAAGLAEFAWQLMRPALDTMAGFIPLFTGKVQWPQLETQGWSRRVRAYVIGVLLAAPLLVVFGALLVSADAMFSRLVARFIDVDLANLVSHLVLMFVCAWVVAGYLAALLLRERDATPPIIKSQWISLGPVEIGVALGLVNLLFLGFIAVQVRYLFGASHWVEVTPGLTYAEYARQGFFQLVAVGALALPVLLGADWLLGAGSRRGFRWLAGAMLLMLLLILASAFHRMRLYQEAYGWTQPRLYVTFFLTWLAAVLVWLGATVLTGRRERFVCGGMVAGLLLLVALHFWNPDAWIARQNLAHARAGRPFDAAYASQLGGDAIPVLVKALPQLSEADRKLVVAHLKRWAERDRPDWRIWSWARMEARQALRGLPME